MTARIIDGNSIAQELKERLRHDLAFFRRGGANPGLGTVSVGDDYASQA
jgi:5,10-methylene-tetrahydrofolate dehydrogenase/methenyl tetrahydrofolate cyclohydrolase